MKMTPVTSSNIAAIGHDKAASELYVEFKNGKTFIYKDVSQTDALKLFQAESVGKHFNQFIKAVKVGREVVNPPVVMSDKEKIKVLREVIEKAISKIEILDDNAMGTGHMHGVAPWSIRDEQLHNLSQALEATKDGE